MQITALDLIANPCDDEEDNMALLCCHGLVGEMFLMARFPDEDEIEITFTDNDPAYVRDIKVTLQTTSLLIEVSAADGHLFNGSDFLEVLHETDAADLPEVLETLGNILRGTGTLVSTL